MSFSGKAIIFSAPSGSGKTTIVKHLAANNENLGFSISACTRQPRTDIESNGKDYYFFTTEEFEAKINNNEFIEWEEVYDGVYYGTLKSEIERLWNEGKHVIFDVDVKGGLNLKNYFGERALAVFVKVPSIDDLEKRLHARGSESAERINQRLNKAKYELSFENQFDVTLLNATLEESLIESQELIEHFLQQESNPLHKN